METISAPTRLVDAARDAARDQRLATLAARRTPAATQRETSRSHDRTAGLPGTGRDAVDARLTALAARRPPVAAGGAPAGRSKRRHAAKGARAMSLGLSLASTGALASFFALSDGQSATQLQAATIVATPGVAAAVPTAAAATATQAVGPTPTVVDLTIAPATAVPVASAPAVAQTVVQGGVFHNKWGDVQVQAVFAADGRLVDVTAVQTPDRDSKSVRINDRAVPLLNTEALAVQSAQVDTVSGATYTSNDYRNSLQSAIDAANAAGLTAIG